MHIGIIFESKISFVLHIVDVCRVLKRVKGIMYAVSSFINRESFMTLF